MAAQNPVTAKAKAVMIRAMLSLIAHQAIVVVKKRAMLKVEVFHQDHKYLSKARAFHYVSRICLQDQVVSLKYVVLHKMHAIKNLCCLYFSHLSFLKVVSIVRAHVQISISAKSASLT